MEVIILPTEHDVSELVATRLQNLIAKKPDSVIGLPTGATPLQVYKKLIQSFKENKIDFQKITTFNLDEYLGLGPKDPNSYFSFMKEVFFDHININIHNTHVLDGLTVDVAKECDQYENSIHHAGGIDLQLLGIGHDGHIAFNEPGSALRSRTRIKALTKETRQANSKYFGSLDHVPTHVLTMGVETILEAKECLLMAFGEHKSRAIAKMVEGAISSSCPASALQFHPNTKIIIDEQAASKLSRVNYYKSVFENKPEWQLKAEGFLSN